MLKRLSPNKWTSLLLIAAMILSVLPPAAGFAAGERITITNLYKAAALVDGRPAPAEEPNIDRYTTNPITIEATIESINSSQVPNIYYEITNMNTGVVIKDTSNKAQMSGAFNITFTNVLLTEGLNKVVLKMDGNVTIASEPHFAYFVPTTSIQDLKINQELWDENKIYPDNPASSTAVNLTGLAPNATDVQMQLYGTSSPKSLFMTNGSFIATGDDINKLTNADFKFNPGDNMLTLAATNSSRTFTLEKNLIYDNGDPFAFNAKIQGVIDDEQVTVGNPVTTRIYLNHYPVLLSSIKVYTDVTHTTPLTIATNYNVGTETTGVNAGKSYIEFTATGNVSGNTRYLEYRTTSEKLVTNPTITNRHVEIDALIKNDVDLSDQGEYRYVEVAVGGETFGPYDLSQYTPAPRVSGFFPATLHIGHSAMDFTVTGQELDNTADLNLEVYSSTGTLIGSYQATESADSYAVFPLPAATPAAAGSYKFSITKDDGTLIEDLVVNVTDPDPAITPEELDGAANAATVGPLDQGYDAVEATQTVTMVDNTFVAANLEVEVFNQSRQSRGSGLNITKLAGPNDDQFTYQLPLNLLAGEYWVQIRDQDHIVTEQHFTVDPPPATPPTLGANAPITLNDFSGISDDVPTYFAVIGSDFGTDMAQFVVNSSVLSDPGGVQADVPLTPYAIQDNLIVFQVDSSDLFDDLTYDLEFTLSRNAVNYPLAIAGFVTSSHWTNGANDGGAPSFTYEGTTVTGINRYQITTADAVTPGAFPIIATGVDMVTARMQAKLVEEDGSPVGLADPGVVVNNAAQTTVTLPAGLQMGNYFLQFWDNDDDGGGTPILLAQFPFEVINPAWGGLSPDTVPVTDLDTTLYTVLGTNLGRDKSKYTLRFSDANGPVANLPAYTIEAGSQLVFGDPDPAIMANLMNLGKGSYTASLIYDGDALATTRDFTVASEPATLIENLARSKDDQYKVFNFNVQLDIGVDHTQLLQFKFYNNPATPKISTFRFTYLDPTLPYVDRVTRMPQNSRLSEIAANEVNELPTTFRVYVDNKTEKVSLYLGEYSSTSVPNATKNSFSTDPNTQEKYVEFTLDNIPNGQRQMIVVPSANNNAGDPHLGENPAGKKTYDMSFTNTPYMIVNTIYTGMVIRDDSELVCSGVAGACINGRLVNVPLTDFNLDTGLAKVEFYLNDSLVVNALNQVTLVNGGPEFRVRVPALEEGKNKISFIIYTKQNGVFTKVTESSFEIFKFSTDAPEFLSLNPVEPNQNETLFRKSTTLADTYTTSQTAVQLTGQIANATEIKLTVRKTLEDGTTSEQYDRRYNGFGNVEPTSGNPNFFSSGINVNTGLFTTSSIALSQEGDTIFEFVITNTSNIQIIKTITITREPLPYVVISPKLTQNSAGDFQANVNSNYVEIELEAEGADQVFFGKTEAISRDVIVNGIKLSRFYYEARNLKNGKNTIKFTVVTGQEELDGEFIIFNTNTVLEGAQFKTPLKNTISAFNGIAKIAFPKGTNFMRNDPTAINQYISADRQILFGIADPVDGRLDKYKHPASTDGQTGNPNPTILADAKFLLAEPTGRFRTASKLLWVDAGTITNNTSDLKDAYSGSGKLPYDIGFEYYNRQLKDLVVPTNRGTLTLEYDKNIRSDAAKYLTVYHYDIYEDSTGVTKARWRNIGGVVNTSNHTITVPVERFGYFQVMFMDQSFDDVTAHPWARNSLDTLYAKGYMLPKQPPALFVPNDPISRGEFATLLVKLFEIPLQYTEDPTFTDVLRVNPLNNGLYDYKYIETAARVGIVRGMSGGRFQPDSAIRRQDAAVMIAKAANMKLQSDDAKVLVSLQKSFTDANTMDTYARASIEAVTKAKLMSGRENTLLQGQKKATFRFDPTEPITRAEAATIGIEILKQQKKIPK